MKERWRSWQGTGGGRALKESGDAQKYIRLKATNQPNTSLSAPAISVLFPSSQPLCHYRLLQQGNIRHGSYNKESRKGIHRLSGAGPHCPPFRKNRQQVRHLLSTGELSLQNPPEFGCNPCPERKEQGKMPLVKGTRRKGFFDTCTLSSVGPLLSV